MFVLVPSKQKWLISPNSFIQFADDQDKLEKVQTEFLKEQKQRELFKHPPWHDLRAKMNQNNELHKCVDNSGNGATNDASRYHGFIKASIIHDFDISWSH